MGTRHKRLQDMAYHIQETVWKCVIDDLEPQVLFLEVDRLRHVPAKDFRDMGSDTYKFLALEGNDGSKVHVSDMDATNTALSRENLRSSTWQVRFLGSLCSNSRRGITRAFPHVLGLRFMHSLNKEKDVGRKRWFADDGLLRFNGDTDLCVMSAAQWERQTHFLRNQPSIRGVFKNIGNLGLDLGTLWNDRLLQDLDSSFVTDPQVVLHSDLRWFIGLDVPDATPLDPSLAWGYETRNPAPNPRRWQWEQACGCWAPNSQGGNIHWVLGEPPAEPPCRVVCRREPLPVFINALPKVRTLVLTAMDDPVKMPRKVASAHRKLFSSGHDGKHALITAGDNRYSITNSMYRGADVMMPTLQRIQSEWRSSFPYKLRIPKVKIKYMRPIEDPRHRQERDKLQRPFHSSDTDIPYVYEIKKPPPTWSRKRSRHSSSQEGCRKRQKTGHSSSSWGMSGETDWGMSTG